MVHKIPNLDPPSCDRHSFLIMIYGVEWNSNYVLSKVIVFGDVADFGSYIWDDSANFVFRPDLRGFSRPHLQRWLDPKEGIGLLSQG